MSGAASKSGGELAADFDLSLPDDVLALAERFHGEWCNGGFAQLFANWNRADILLIPDALKAIGMADAAGIVEAAMADLPAGSNWRELGRDALLSRAEALGARLWERDRAFDAYEGALWQSIETYEAQHADDDF